jgi:3-phenylpropionate/trans-cinnamate dioxygenase ferredoxin subunit
VSEWVTVARRSEFVPGEARVVVLDDEELLLVELDGRLVAVENRCSHDGSPLEGGGIVGGCLVCPFHGSRFDLSSGEALNPPAYEPIHVFPVRERDGEVQVRDDRDD